MHWERNQFEILVLICAVKYCERESVSQDLLVSRHQAGPPWSRGGQSRRSQRPCLLIALWQQPLAAPVGAVDYTGKCQVVASFLQTVVGCFRRGGGQPESHLP